MASNRGLKPSNLSLSSQSLRHDDWREVHAAVAQELQRIDDAMGAMRRRSPRLSRGIRSGTDGKGVEEAGFGSRSSHRDLDPGERSFRGGSGPADAASQAVDQTPPLPLPSPSAGGSRWTLWITTAAVALVSLGALASTLAALAASMAPASPSALAGICSRLTAVATAVVVGAGKRE